MKVLILSIARNILKNESRDRERMRMYANSVSSMHIIVLTRKGHGYREEVHEGNLHIYPTHSSNRLLMLIDAFRIGGNIAHKNKEEDLVVSAQDPLFIGWLAWLLSKTEKTELNIQVHGDYFSPHWSNRSPIRIIQRTVAYMLLKVAPSVRVVSERSRLSLINRGIDGKKVTVLPIRPELERFLERRHFYVEKPTYSFLFVGRFSPEKDVKCILSAFLQIYKVRQDIRLQLVGEGEELSIITNFIKAKKLEGVVSVAEWTEDVPDIMANADVLLLASKHEAYGLVLIEAMAVGLPIISTDVGCVGEVVKDGVHGIIVKNKGVKAYAEAIQKMVSNTDTMKTYGENGRKTAEEIANISMDDYVDAWVNTMSQ